MKHRRLILLAVFILVVVGVFIFQKSSSNLSPDQKELINLWGYPDQFKISYLPRGEDELVRSEVWIYHDQQKQVQFLAGNSIASNSYQPTSDIQTTLKPEDFSFSQNVEDVGQIVGEGALEPIDFLPGISDDEEEIIIYISPQAIFTIEHDHLTYVETLGLEISQETISDDFEEEIQKEIQEEENTSSYHSDFLGFSTSYPQNWYLESDVLTTYDANKPLDQITLPNEYLKCDFVTYNSESTSIINQETIYQEQITILKGDAQDQTDFDGPGLGDAIMFRIQDDNTDISLICFSYHLNFETDLINMLKSITFDSP